MKYGGFRLKCSQQNQVSMIRIIQDHPIISPPEAVERAKSMRVDMGVWEPVEPVEPEPGEKAGGSWDV